LKAMKGLPVTIRLLDPPLHEFVPKGKKEVARLAKSLGITAAEFHKRADGLRESNPMMGHRGVRLGITYPEVSEMQIRAVLEATAEIVKAGGKARPELMIPVLCDVGEFKVQKEIVDRVYAETKAKYGLRKIPLLVGTMIEIPRACLLADRIAEEAEFFSFGTNDLTQMTFGFSRDDIGGFMGEYLERGILKEDPFQVVDIEGMGQLMEMAIRKGRGARPDLKVGICGEHGGEPASIAFCHHVGMDYVSCSPFRVPIARLAAAQAEIAEPRKSAKKKSGRKKAAKKKGKK
ncbi:MAG: pyruvate, phosphate dikinase, partial [Planctomycetia bacterium]|nr:pyruvate, phosphate dikinase [Planctomycetia bacterium]